MAFEQFVYSFEEADPTNLSLFGGKGAGLAGMTLAGLPVPPGFIVTTDAARSFLASGKIAEDLLADVRRYIERLEARTGRRFGGGPVPLLVSVRSGAPLSMPGMMDTILNLGLNEEAAVALATATGSVPFMADVYSRFHRMFADIVLDLDGSEVAEAVAEVLPDVLPTTDPLVAFHRVRDAAVRAERDIAGETVPDDPYEQLERAIAAVFQSWNSRRAVTYRRLHGIADNLGTAVVVQTMVFGNLGSPSGSGVVFSRDPATGEPELFGEFLEGGQGEDVVSGAVTPRPIAEASRRLPEVFSKLRDNVRTLEQRYRDVVDVEFTVEQGQLYLLQVRGAKRSAQAAVRIAADFLREGRLDAAEAFAHVTVDDLRQLEKPRFEVDALQAARAGGALLGHGIGASPGQVSGIVVLDPDRAVTVAGGGANVILTRPTTSPLDLHGMIASVGILTTLGGATSHAAVVARALGKPCVVGCRDLCIDAEARHFSIDGVAYEEGAVVSIDGATGEIFAGALPLMVHDTSTSHRGDVLSAARDAARCRVYGIATTVEQVGAVLSRGAAGVAIRIGQVLETTGHFDELVNLLLNERDTDALDLTSLEQIIADTLTPVLAAAGDADIAVRALDLMSEESVEFLDPLSLLAAHPRLGLPMGIPELLRAQVAGLASAVERSGCRTPELVVRRLCDPLETRELRRITLEQLARGGPGRVRVGAFVTSLRAAQLIPELATATDVLWLDARRLQAGAFGFHPSLFLTAEPLDEYVRRGMLSLDPRTAVDEAQLQFLGLVAIARVRTPTCKLGVRLPAPVSEPLAAAYYRAGIRMFAVDTEEVQAADFVLGKAALSDMATLRSSRR